jgi:hypothetical protein
VEATGGLAKEKNGGRTAEPRDSIDLVNKELEQVVPGEVSLGVAIKTDVRSSMAGSTWPVWRMVESGTRTRGSIRCVGPGIAVKVVPDKSLSLRPLRLPIPTWISSYALA